MEERDVVYVGLDVDDKKFHGSALDKRSGALTRFVSNPTIGHLMKKLEEFKGEGKEMKVCYEATYLGYSLQRGLSERGVNCAVIAPSLIPRKPGESIKTDKIDSKNLAIYYSNGQLTEVNIPSEEDEEARAIVRTRNFFSIQQRRIKLHILSNCRRMGINYRVETGNENGHHWTKGHREWLERQIKGRAGYEFNMTMLMGQLEEIERRIELYDEKVEEISKVEKYRERVKALISYRGIELTTAMTLITELVDIKRFKHPKKLCSYAGMDLVEYSSGGKERRYSMSKKGNQHIRRSIIEACQRAGNLPRVGKTLKARRAGIAEEYIEVAERCMNRLYKKWRRLMQRGKPTNKVKVACARELLCFVWESLMLAEGETGLKKEAAKK